jgi:hypothetical protein
LHCKVPKTPVFARFSLGSSFQITQPIPDDNA